MLTPALRVITVDSQSRDELDKSEAVVEHITMPALARLVLERDKARQSDPFCDLDMDSTGRLEVLVVAWACARNGYPDLAVKLYEKAEATLEHGDKEGSSFPDRLAADIAHMETWRATLLCETQMPRSELHERFRWLKRHFPQSKHAADVAEKVAVLETMVAEDERHARERAAGPPLSAR